MKPIHEGLKALGASANINSGPYAEAQEGDPAAVLEAFNAPSAYKETNPRHASLSLEITVTEFTSLCPVTGQPDFATIKISYVPDEWCVESKSLKLYMLAYRNRRDFHESCVVKMCNDLVSLLHPISITVKGEFTPRGGIPFWPTCAWSRE